MNFAFLPQGATKLLSVSTSTAIDATQVCTGGQQGMYIANPSTNAVYLAFGSSSVGASLPSTGTASAGLCLPNGAAGTFRTPPAGWLSAVTSAGTATVYATAGEGL